MEWIVEEDREILEDNEAIIKHLQDSFPETPTSKPENLNSLKFILVYFLFAIIP